MVSLVPACASFTPTAPPTVPANAEVVLRADRSPNERSHPGRGLGPRGRTRRSSYANRRYPLAAGGLGRGLGTMAPS